MSNITVGIIAKDKEAENTNMQIITKNNLKYLHNKCNYVGLLNYDSIRWQRLRILETLNIPVEEDMLDGTLHTNHFLVPDERLNEYLDIAPLPKEINLNSEEIMESSRTYIYRGIPFSKNKVRRNLTLLGKETPDYIEVLTAGRQFTQKEIDTMKQNYTK